MPANPKAEALLADLPKLHIWGGQPQVGGMDRRIGQRLIDEITALESPVVLETGAGASTLLFLCLEPRSLISIAPDAELRDRMLAEADARDIPVGPLRFVVDRSEVALPPLAQGGEVLDVALIDGNHGWPSVFVDFCYVNYMLRTGGILFVDDVQLHSVGQLFLLLRQQEDAYELVALEGKLATFRKVGDQRYLPDWRQEPFIAKNSFMV